MTKLLWLRNEFSRIFGGWDDWGMDPMVIKIQPAYNFCHAAPLDGRLRRNNVNIGVQVPPW